MGKKLLITASLGMGLLTVLVVTFYLVYPDEFHNVLLRYNPLGDRVTPVIGDEPTLHGADPKALPVLGASALAFGASPRGTGFSAVSTLLIARPDQNLSPPLDKSTLIEFKLPFTDREQRRVLIYLPKGFQAGHRDPGYPTLYLLHGSPGLEGDWIELGHAKDSLDEAIANKVLPPVIAVFPNGNGGFQDDSEYINSPDGRQPNEDFIVKTLVTFVDSKFPTRAEGKYRAIGGLSEGGYGALNLALKHQDVFGCVLSLSGYGNIDRNPHADEVIQGSTATVHDNSPLLYIPELKDHVTKILIFIGAQDDLLQENQELDKLLKAQGFAVDYRSPPGSHRWTFWTEHLKEGLVWWGKQLPA